MLRQIDPAQNGTRAREPNKIRARAETDFQDSFASMLPKTSEVGDERLPRVAIALQGLEVLFCSLFGLDLPRSAGSLIPKTADLILERHAGAAIFAEERSMNC